jgi:hypothetical protein
MEEKGVEEKNESIKENSLGVSPYLLRLRPFPIEDGKVFLIAPVFADDVRCLLDNASAAIFIERTCLDLR